MTFIELHYSGAPYMLHQVWTAGLHDAANCFQDALEAKWKLESQRSADEPRR